MGLPVWDDGPPVVVASGLKGKVDDPGLRKAGVLLRSQRSISEINESRCELPPKPDALDSNPNYAT